jgi:excisionase family DNA binding protein
MLLSVCIRTSDPVLIEAATFLREETKEVIEVEAVSILRYQLQRFDIQWELIPANADELKALRRWANRPAAKASQEIGSIGGVSVRAFVSWNEVSLSLDIQAVGEDAEAQPDSAEAACMALWGGTYLPEHFEGSDVIDIQACTDSAGDWERQIETLLTAPEAAKHLRLHPVTVLKWARQGKIPHRKLGRKVLFPLSLLNRWLEAGYTDSAVRAASTEEREAA